MERNGAREALTRVAAAEPVPAARMMEDILGCKWSLTLLSHIRRGVRRPGALERSVDGLTTKVMNERLAKLVRYGVLTRTAYPEVPPRVEYTLTAFGQEVVRIVDAIEALEGRRS